MKGLFNVKSAYRMVIEDILGEADMALGKVWRSRLLERLKVLFWLEGCDLLMVRARLIKVFPIPSKKCVLCGKHTKTLCRLICWCKFPRLLWFQSQ